jgi:hypothetical protein
MMSVLLCGLLAWAATHGWSGPEERDIRRSRWHSSDNALRIDFVSDTVAMVNGARTPYTGDRAGGQITVVGRVITLLAVPDRPAECLGRYPIGPQITLIRRTASIRARIATGCPAEPEDPWPPTLTGAYETQIPYRAYVTHTPEWSGASGPMIEAVVQIAFYGDGTYESVSLQLVDGASFGPAPMGRGRFWEVDDELFLFTDDNRLLDGFVEERDPLGFATAFTVGGYRFGPPAPVELPIIVLPDPEPLVSDTAVVRAGGGDAGRRPNPSSGTSADSTRRVIGVKRPPRTD